MNSPYHLYDGQFEQEKYHYLEEIILKPAFLIRF